MQRRYGRRQFVNQRATGALCHGHCHHQAAVIEVGHAQRQSPVALARLPAHNFHRSVAGVTIEQPEFRQQATTQESRILDQGKALPAVGEHARYPGEHVPGIFLALTIILVDLVMRLPARRPPKFGKSIQFKCQPRMTCSHQSVRGEFGFCPQVTG